MTEQERAVLAFEARAVWWKYAGAKEAAIRETLGLSPTRYYQVLNGALELPEALAAEPLLVRRLLRLRSSRAEGRRVRRARP